MAVLIDHIPVLSLAVSGVMGALLTLGFLIVCLLMILIVLIQRPQGGGLGGAFGSSAGSGQTAFGAKTGDALTMATIGIFVVFVLGAIGLNFVARPSQAEQDQSIVAPEGEAQEAAAGGEAGGSDDAASDGAQDSETAAEPTPETDPTNDPATDPSTDTESGEAPETDGDG